MATKRLTHVMRRIMAERVANKAFDAKIAVMSDSAKRAGSDLYLKCMGDRIKIFDFAPKEYFQHYKAFCVVIGKIDKPTPLFEAGNKGDYSRNKYLSIGISAYVPVPAFATNTSTTFVVDLKMAELVKYEKLNGEVKALKLEKIKCRDAARIILKSFFNVGQLIKGWPDVESLIPEEYLDGNKMSLPAPQLAEVNKLLSQAT